MRLIGNEVSITSCRDLFRTFSIIPVMSLCVCVCKMETVHYTALNKCRLEQNSVCCAYNAFKRSDRQPQFCRTNIFKKSVSSRGTKLYNNVPFHLKNLKDKQLLRRKLNSLLLQQAFDCVQKYLSYELLSWKM
jgi:hypothetical protein